MFGRDGFAIIENVDTVGVGLRIGVTPALHRCRKGRFRCAALPKIGISAKLDGTCPGSELAGIVQDIDENLLDLARFKIEGMLARYKVGGDSDRLVLGEWSNLMQRLFQALPNIAWPQVRSPLYVAPDAQLEHGGGHAGEPLGAVLHAAQHLPLVLRQRAQRFTQEQSAIPADGGERGPKIVDGARQERCAVLIVLL